MCGIKLKPYSAAHMEKIDRIAEYKSQKIVDRNFRDGVDPSEGVFCRKKRDTPEEQYESN